MRVFRTLLVVAFFATTLFPASGQDYRQAFDDFARAAKEIHRNFGDSLNAEFVKTISSNWEHFHLSEPSSASRAPQPDSPVIASESGKSLGGALKTSEVVDTLSDALFVDYPVSHSTVATIRTRTVRFSFYNNIQEINIPSEYGYFHPSGVSESNVGEFWNKLSQENYQMILSQCSDIIINRGFNDWAVLEWVQALSEAIFPDDIHSERTIFTVFILNQMGLMVRLARVDDRLESLFASVQDVFARKYAVIDTYQYYLTDTNPAVYDIYTYRSNFTGKLRPFDLRIKKPLSLGGPDAYTANRFSSQVFNCDFEVPLNNALKLFYGRYPQTTVNVYAQSIPDRKFSDSLLGQLKAKIEGLDGMRAVNELLRFMQYDFSYKVDSQQFGYEKQFFCEENFMYEANDCEDRAILFSYLVRQLTEFKVVLLEYEDHIATAVDINAPCKGHYIRLAENKYYICDPTYIGATAGMCIPRYAEKKARIYIL